MCLPLHHSAFLKPCDHLATTAGFVFKNIMNVLLTLTYSVFLDKPVNVALAVEHRSADLEERDTSA